MRNLTGRQNPQRWSPVTRAATHKNLLVWPMLMQTLQIRLRAYHCSNMKGDNTVYPEKCAAYKILHNRCHNPAGFSEHGLYTCEAILKIAA